MSASAKLVLLVSTATTCLNPTHPKTHQGSPRSASPVSPPPINNNKPAHLAGEHEWQGEDAAAGERRHH